MVNASETKKPAKKAAVAKKVNGEDQKLDIVRLPDIQYFDAPFVQGPGWVKMKHELNWKTAKNKVGLATWFVWRPDFAGLGLKEMRARGTKNIHYFNSPGAAMCWYNSFNKRCDLSKSKREAEMREVSAILDLHEAKDPTGEHIPVFIRVGATRTDE